MMSSPSRPARDTVGQMKDLSLPPQQLPNALLTYVVREHCLPVWSLFANPVTGSP